MTVKCILHCQLTHLNAELEQKIVYNTCTAESRLKAGGNVDQL